jgi:hypothetical protein
MIFRSAVCGYVAMCFIVAMIRNPTLVLWVKNFVVDMVIAPFRLWTMLVTKPDPNGDGGSVRLKAGNGSGTGSGGDVVLSVGLSEMGSPGHICFDHAYEDGRGLRVLVDGKVGFIPVHGPL